MENGSLKPPGSEGASGRAEFNNAACSTGTLFLLFANVLRCTRSVSSSFIISSTVNKISAYGYTAQAARYVRTVF